MSEYLINYLTCTVTYKVKSGFPFSAKSENVRETLDKFGVVRKVSKIQVTPGKPRKIWIFHKINLSLLAISWINNFWNKSFQIFMAHTIRNTMALTQTLNFMNFYVICQIYLQWLTIKCVANHLNLIIWYSDTLMQCIVHNQYRPGFSPMSFRKRTRPAQFPPRIHFYSV